MITATHKGKYYDVEYSIVNVSELEGELRIDAEYYDPFYLRNEEKIKKKKWEYLVDKIKGRTITDGSHEIREYVENGILFLRVQDIFENYIEIQEKVYISKEENERLRRSEPRKYKDILITKTGKIGIATVFHLNERANIPADIAILKNDSSLNPFYISTFINTIYGKISMQRQMSGLGRPRLVLESFKYIKIPIPSYTFQKFIEKLVLKAYEERQKAEQLYKKAEEILLEELGLKNWKPKTKKIKIGGREFEEEENISIRTLLEVIKTDRMDAEYWEPKYYEIEEIIRNYKNGFSYIKDEFIKNTTKFKINKDEYYNYVEISSINTSTGDFTPSYLQGKDLPASAKIKLNKNDLIISKVRTYRKGIALINKIYPNLIGSSAFVVLHEKENKRISIETLFVFLRTDIFSLWSYKFYTGTSYPTLTDEDILNLPIPLIDSQIQQKISELIQESFKVRENVKKLLEITKRTAEVYIEKDEQEGLNYARNKLKELNMEIK